MGGGDGGLSLEPMKAEYIEGLKCKRCFLSFHMPYMQAITADETILNLLK